MATEDTTSVLPTEWREGMMLLSVRFRLLPAATSVSIREICIQKSSADHREIAPPGNIMTQDTADIRDRLRAEMPTEDTRDRLPAEISSADIRIRAIADIRGPDMMSIPEMFRPARVPFPRDLSAATRVISP